MKFVRLHRAIKGREDTSILVNMDKVITMDWYESDKATTVMYAPGSEEDCGYFEVRETPEEILSKLGYEPGDVI